MQLIGPYKRQAGVTIVELLIGMALGVIVIGGGILMYLASVQNSGETLRNSRLNQEISSLLLVMSNDIRRAGYWDAITNTDYHLNPFSQPGETTLVVIDDMANNNIQSATGNGSCITYAYDATYQAGNTSGTIDTTDLFGFRLNGTVVQMRQAGVVDGTQCVGGSCDSCQNGTWANVTDPDLIEITSLNFDLANSLCLNAAEPNLVDDNGDGTIDDANEINCYTTIPAIGSENATVESREVVVTVAARLANDPLVQSSASQTIRVRNDLLRLR